MKIINTKTGEILEDVKYIDTSLTTIEIRYLDNGVLRIKTEKDYHSFLQNWKDYEQSNVPLIKDENIRKAVRAWAVANSRDLFRVINEHFNCCKIIGYTDNGNASCNKIEFGKTIKGADKNYYYTIAELCG